METQAESFKRRRRTILILFVLAWGAILVWSVASLDGHLDNEQIILTASVLALIGLPGSVIALGVIYALEVSSLIPGEAVLGRIVLIWTIFAAFAYVQWVVLLPRLLAYLSARWSSQAGRSSHKSVLP